MLPPFTSVRRPLRRLGACVLVLAAARPAPAQAQGAAAGTHQVKDLVGQLNDADPAVRAQASSALTALGPEAIPAILDSVVLRALTGQAERWADGMTKALVGMGRPAALPLGRALGERDVFARAIAAAALERLGRDAEPAAADLGRALGADPLVAISAEGALEHLGAAAVPALSTALGGSAAAAERAARSLGALGQDADPRVEAALRALPPERQATTLVLLAEPAANGDAAARERAAALYDRALRLAPTAIADEARLRALLFLLHFHEEAGRDAAAAPYAARVLEESHRDPQSVKAVADFHIHFGRPEVAEKLYRAQLDQAHDAKACRALAFFYGYVQGTRPARREEAIRTLEACSAAAPRDVELLQSVVALTFDWVYHDPTLGAAAKAAYVQRGLEAENEVLAISPEAFEALVYKGMLLEQQAALESSPARKQALLEEAAALKKHGFEAKKRQNEQTQD